MKAPASSPSGPLEAPVFGRSPAPGTALASLRGRSAAARWTRAGVGVALMLGASVLGVRMLAGAVRDRTPAEIRQAMVRGGDGALPLDEAIEQLNRLDVRERRSVMRSSEAQAYFQRLRPKERMRFVRETLDRGIREQIERYRGMNAVEKQRFIEEVQARQEEMRQRMDEAPPGERARLRELAGSPDIKRTIERAVKEFLKVTTSEERAQLAPLFDGALENLQHARSLR